MNDGVGFSAKQGQIARVVEVALPRPREREAQAFSDLRRELLSWLGVDEGEYAADA